MMASWWWLVGSWVSGVVQTLPFNLRGVIRGLLQVYYWHLGTNLLDWMTSSKDQEAAALQNLLIPLQPGSNLILTS